MESEKKREGKEIIKLDEPQIVVVLGKVGVGKTSVAEEIAKRLGSIRLSSDEFRRKKFGEVQFQTWHSDIAMKDMIDAVEALFVSEVSSVVLDATFSSRTCRNLVKELANKYQKKIIWIEVRCDEASLSRDLIMREVAGAGNIDGDWVPREVDDLEDIEERMVVDNSIRDRNKQEQIKNLLDKYVF